MALNFLKTGAESAKMAQQAATEAEIYKESKGKLWRFFLKNPEEASVTFVDGDLTAEGFLLPPRFYEHFILWNGTWTNFVCPEKTMPDAVPAHKCPICESGDRPSLVAAFTIIDHRANESKGKTYKDSKRLMVVKPQTFEILNKYATKMGGLAGMRFDVSRSGENPASVGSVFIPMGKKPIAELQAMYTREVTDPKHNTKKIETYFTPANYEEEIVFRSGIELAKLGLGKPDAAAPGVSSTAAGNMPPAVDFSQQL